MTVHITIQWDPAACGRGREPSVRWLKRQLGAAAEQMPLCRGRWSIWLLDDRRMAELHERTLHRSGPTDVLAFDYRPDPSRADILDLETCAGFQQAQRQARARGHPPRHELLLYLIHSLLHVCGYDDHAPAAARRMHRREDAILANLGFGPVYYRRRARLPPASALDHRTSRRHRRRQ